jgi:hypothetical protein
VTANGWRTASNNTAKLARSPLKHLCGTIMSPLLAQSGHAWLDCTCLLLTQSGPRSALISLDGKSVEETGLLVACDMLGLVWHFGPRSKCCGGYVRCDVGRRLGLCSEHGLRCHIGRGRGRIRKGSCRIVILGRWQTRALASDYRRRPGLQRCICNEQQCNQRQTYCCQKG